MAAELLELPLSTVADYSHGSSPNNLEAVGRFCKKLNIDFEWLVLGTKSNTNLSEIPLEDLFQEERADFDGIYRLKLIKLTRKPGGKKI